MDCSTQAFLLPLSPSLIKFLSVECMPAQLLQSFWTFSQPHGPKSTRNLCPWVFPGKNAGVGCHTLFQGILPTWDEAHSSYTAHILFTGESPRKPHPLNRYCYLPTLPLPPFSPFAFTLSQPQGLFQWADFSHQVVKLLELHFQHQSFQIIFTVDFFFFLELTGLISLESETLKSFLQLHNSKASNFWHFAFFIVTSEHDCWKNHSFGYMDLCWHNDVSAFLIHCLGLSQFSFQGTSIF